MRTLLLAGVALATLGTTSAMAANIALIGQLGALQNANILQVDLTGKNERKLDTPVDGSDPAWGPLRP